MKSAVATLVLSFLPLATAGKPALLDVNAGKQYPVTKVVTLLKDMQAQLEKEAEEDEEAYDKMACWCKTNDRDKTMSITEAEARINDLTTTIESTAAASGRLKTEIANEASDLAKSDKALAQLTAMRGKQAKEFNEEEKDMLQSIKALDSAIVVLSKHHGGGGGAALDQSALATIAQVMQTQMHNHQALLQGAITPHQRRVVLGGFLQQAGRQPKGRSYQPQSSEIFGILRQMKETFEGNLADSQKEELANAKAFEEQKAAKGDEIKAITASLDEKKTQLAKSDETNAQSKEDLEDTQDSLSVDDKFLIDLKERCKMTDQEWELRQKSRQEEITAIVQAIAILTDDSARDTFSSTFNPAASFVQRSASSNKKHSDQRQKAVELLRATAAKTSSPELAGLAMAAELDAFTKVKAAIDKMVKQLIEEKQAEITKKDYCTEKLNENELLTEKQVRKKSDSESKIAGLETSISELTENIGTIDKEIAEMNLQIKRAGEDRELVNRDFQATVADQRETQKLLQKALTVLKAVYTKTSVSQEKAALSQESSEVVQAPPPPPGFKDYSQSRGGGGAVGLLEQIMGDAKVLEAEAVKDEQTAQATYEKMIKDTNKSIRTKLSAKVNKSEDKAKAEQDLGNTKSDFQAQSTELETLGNSKQDLKLDCDFLLKNFDVRQQAREEEVEALRQAKAILSGMQVD
jgi:hypothetical protein